MPSSQNPNKFGNQKAILLALLGVALILVVLVIIDLTRKPAGKEPITNNPVASENEVQEPIAYEEVLSMTPEKRDEFKEEVPADIVVPGVDTQLTEAEKKEIALPTVVVPAAPGSDSKFRNFKISADQGAFTPTKVIANVGDTVHIDFTAVDGDYDIVFPSYNMMQKATKGQTKVLGFQALREGSFTYYCSSCGGPETGPKGTIIIVP